MVQAMACSRVCRPAFVPALPLAAKVDWDPLSGARLASGWQRTSAEPSRAPAAKLRGRPLVRVVVLVHDGVPLAARE
jgi:hypothetical protein